MSAPNRSPQHHLPIGTLDNLQLELYEIHGRLGCFTRSIVTNFLPIAGTGMSKCNASAQ